MKLVVVVFVVLGTICQAHSQPVEGNPIDIDFSEENEIGNVEEALFMYTELLRAVVNQKSGIRENSIADSQKTPLCSDPSCECSLKQADYTVTLKSGQKCTAYGLYYCEGVCSTSYRCL